MPTLFELTHEFLSEAAAAAIEHEIPNMADRFLENPYSLLDVMDENQNPYVIFPDLDRNVTLDSFSRRLSEMKYAISYILTKNEDSGNSWMPYQDVNKEVKALLCATGHPLFHGSAREYLNYYNNLFYFDKEKGRVGFNRTRNKEWTIYQNVLRAKRTRCRFSQFTPVDLTEVLSPEQLTSAKNVVSLGGNMAILIGGPGTGKTTTIKSVITGLQREYPNSKIAILAPTGRAAKRVQEEFQDFENGDDLFQIGTIYHFVGYGRTFLTPAMKRDIRATDFIVIDESSMITVDIFETLLSLIDVERTKIVLVGDSNQLPAIGVGNILCDLIKIGVYTEQLTVNYRSNAPIINNSIRLQDGNPFPYLSEDFVLMECPKAFITQLLSTINKDGDAILSPYRKEDKFGNTEHINRAIQVKRFGTYTQFANRFNIGDHVILTKTNYHAGYFNGDTGILVGYDRAKDGYVVSLGQQDLNDIDTEHYKTVIVTDDAHIELAYSITIHKSQGSEYECADIILPEYSSFITKKVLYTAITRAKRKVRVWTTPEIYRKVILTPETPRRTFLSSWVTEKMSA